MAKNSNHGISDTVAMAPANIMQCVVVTPEATVWEGVAQFLALPLFDGEIGIAARHAPMIGRLGYGEMRIVEGPKTMRFYVDGGFVQVSDNTVYVLTNRAVPAKEIDVAVAEEHLAQARRRPATSAELLAKREQDETRARAQILVAQRFARAR
jgi:F-type H+-transporting ATPase subunit epsilon